MDDFPKLPELEELDTRYSGVYDDEDSEQARLMWTDRLLVMHHRDTKRLRELDAGHAFYIPAREYRLPGTSCFQRIALRKLPAKVAHSNIGQS